MKLLESFASGGWEGDRCRDADSRGYEMERTVATTFDFLMLAFFKGKKRTLSEFRDLGHCS